MFDQDTATQLMHLGAWFFEEVGRQPLRWPFFFAVPLLIFRLLPFWPRLLRLIWQRGPGWLAVTGGVLTAGYLVTTISYFTTPGYVDHIEPTVSSVSWYAVTGKPVYTELNSDNCYNGAYGPDLYLLNGLFLKVLGPSIGASKCAGILAAMVSVAAVGLALRSVAPARTTWVLLGVFVCLLGLFGAYSFWVRPDPILLACVAVSLLAAMKYPAAATVVLGGAAGISLNLKLHSAAYFLPLAVLTFQRKRWRGLLTAGTIGAAVFCMPFMLPNISLRNYLMTLREAGAHGLSGVELTNCASYTVSGCVCLLALAFCAFRGVGWSSRQLGKDYGACIVALIGGMALVCVPASKHGAGPHHLIPFLPLILVGARIVISRSDTTLAELGAFRQIWLTLLLSWVACDYLSGAQRMRLEWKPGIRPCQRAQGADLERVIERYGSRYVLLCGAGGDADYSATLFRPLLVFAGFPIGPEPGALMDRKRGGTPLPTLKQFLAQLRRGSQSGKPVMWLIPRGAKPFSLHTAYPPQDRLFPPQFQEDFEKAFTRTAASVAFDLYTPAD
jgi:hypothetical protein